MPIRLTDNFRAPGSATVSVAHVGVSPMDHLTINRIGKVQIMRRNSNKTGTLLQERILHAIENGRILPRLQLERTNPSHWPSPRFAGRGNRQLAWWWLQDAPIENWSLKICQWQFCGRRT
jgi:hypothetical protein